MSAYIRKTFVAVLLCASMQAASAQTYDNTAMPFLRMGGDARTAALGGATTAVTDSPMAIYTNAATAVSNEKRGGVGVTAGPWDNSFDSANALYSLGGYYTTPDRNNAVLAGVRYLNGPRIGLTDDAGNAAGTAHPHDLSAEVGYARRIVGGLSLALTARYMHSDLDLGDGATQGFGFDVAAAWRGNFSNSERGHYTIGLRAADIGPKVKGTGGERYTLPTRISAGGAVNVNIHPKHTLGFVADVCYQFHGKIADMAVGAEYTFLSHGVVRGGYHIGSKNRGEGSYGTVGCGFKAGPVRVDAACRLGGSKFSPLNPSYIFSLGVLL